MAKPLHPAARILLWCGWAVGVELAPLPVLYGMAVVTATAFVFSHLRINAWRLLRRSRWLMLVLLLTYAYTLPGNPAWPELGSASPTLEGIQGGFMRILRLALILVALAILLTSTARPRLIYGLYFLVRPFTVIGFDRRAFAVRLGLTLAYVEQASETPHTKATSWLQRLQQPLIVADTPSVYSLAPERWKWRDNLAMLALSALLAALL